jgi:AcrR family transcriptional regulator
MTTAPARRERSDAVANRDALLLAAQRTLAADPRASIDAIAQAAGLSRRSVYGHFADRETLVAAVIARGAERFNAIAEATTDPDPVVALATLSARLWREAVAVQAAASISLDDAHVDETARALGPLRAAVRRIVDDGIAAGTMRRDIDPAALARLIEEAARAALRRIDAERTPDACALVVKVVLGIAGLSWRESAAVLAAHPELVEG